MTYRTGRKAEDMLEAKMAAWTEWWNMPHPNALRGRDLEITVISDGDDDTNPHSFVARGVFTGMGWTNDEGLVFYISIPDYKGHRIRYLYFDAHQWYLKLEHDFGSVFGHAREVSRSDDQMTALSNIVEQVERKSVIAVTNIHFEGL